MLTYCRSSSHADNGHADPLTLDWVARNCFNIYWHRQTGEWFDPHRGLNIAHAIETITLDELLHPH